MSRLGQGGLAAALLLATRGDLVAELAAAGLTNREIAERMFISLRTAGANGTGISGRARRSA
jgi:DNA-binding NarL/FixJ family response regulator